MAPEYFIHIGFGRTGTSSIQAYMSENRAALAENGMCYPIGRIPTCHHDLLLTQGERDRFLTLQEQGEAWTYVFAGRVVKVPQSGDKQRNVHRPVPRWPHCSS